MRPLGFILVAAVAVCAGCGGEQEQEAPGMRGPLVFRVWNAKDRAAGAPPTIIRADSVRQGNADFSDLTMVPVLVRRPLPDGVVWVHAPSGTFQAIGSGPGKAEQEIALTGPVHLTGVVRGLPVSGVAATATVPRGTQTLELTEVRLVRGGMVMTTPRARLAEGALVAYGPVDMSPGSPALTAVLGAVPP